MASDHVTESFITNIINSKSKLSAVYGIPKGTSMLFTIYFVLYLHFIIYQFQSTFLPYTTFNLLFLVLLFTISDLLLFLPFTTFNLILYVPYTVFVLLYTTSSLRVLLFILLLFFYTFYYHKFYKLLYTILVLLYTTSLLFFTVTSHLLQPKL